MVKLDSPAGRVTAYAQVNEAGSVDYVKFHNVPCFIYKKDIEVEIEGYGTIHADIVYGGCFYAYVDAAQFGVDITPGNVSKLTEIGVAVKKAAEKKYPIQYPTENSVNWLYGTMLLAPLKKEGNKIYVKNICIFADGEVDRSPTGTPSGGRVAQLYACA